MKKKIVIKDFTGGIGTAGEKKDVPNSFRFLKGLTPYEDTSYITNSKLLSKVSGSTITDLIHWAEDGSPWNTNRYFLSSGGKMYQENAGGVWSTLGTISVTSGGEGLQAFDDYLYYANDITLGRYGRLSGTPAFADDFLSDGTTDKDQSGGGTGQSYSTAIAINEGATHRQSFTPDNDPLKSIIIDVTTIGTGDWTVTVHDANNNTIGTATLTNANVIVGDNTFTFGTALRLTIGNTYHFHVTTTVADGAVTTSTASDLEDAEYTTLFGILITADWHPMEEFLNFLVIGNERYIAKWDQATYEPNFISLPAGFKVRTIAKQDEFLAIGAYKGATPRQAEASRIYFWDGIERTFNYFQELRIGAPNALINHSGDLIGIYGERGSIKKGKGEPFQDIVDDVPKLANGKYLEVYPGAVTDARGGNTLIGISAVTDDATGLEQGIYEWGSQQNQIPESFTYTGILSTGTTQGTTLKIGMVKSMGTDVYVGWRDDATYGVDKVSIDSNFVASGSLESLLFDGGDPDIPMLPLNLTITFETLTANQTVTPKYKLDRASSWTTGTAATSGAVEIEEPIFTRCNEIEIGFDFTSTSNTQLKITSVKLTYDDLAEERHE